MENKINYYDLLPKCFIMSPGNIPKLYQTLEPNTFSGKATSQIQKSIEVVNKKKKKFYDTEFPKNWKSIYGYAGSKEISKKVSKKLEWLKPNYIFGKDNYNVFAKGINSSDIIQGKLADCYFQSATSALAECPERLHRLFYPKEPDELGIYSVFLNVAGVWEEVVIDHRFPCDKKKKVPWFNTSKTNEIWVMLLEKAYAKVHGGYANISWGVGRYAFTDLTGAPCETHLLSKFDVNKKEDPELEKHWQNLRGFISSNYSLVGLTSNQNNSGTDDVNKHTGLVANHYYTIISVNEVHFNNGSKRQVKLRNPWSKGEWKGKWSDFDPIWTEKMLKVFKYERLHNGYFFMEFPDFCTYFKLYVVLYFEDTYRDSNFKLKLDSHKQYLFKFDQKVPGKHYFMLHQISNFMLPKTYNKKEDIYRYGDISLSIYRKDFEDQGHYVTSIKKNDKQTFCSADDLPIGTYYAKITPFWKHNIKDLTFSIYAPDITSIMCVSNKELSQEFMYGVIRSRAYQDTASEWKPLGKDDICYKFVNCDDLMGFFFIENNNSNFILEYTVQFTQPDNIFLQQPFYQQTEPLIKVYPKSSDVIWFEYSLPSAIKMKQNAKLVKYKDSIEKNIRENAQMYNRTDESLEEEIGIKQFFYCDEDFTYYFYENSSVNYELIEYIQFDLIGCEIVGESGDGIRIQLAPGYNRLIKIEKKDNVGNYNQIDYDKCKFYFDNTTRNNNVKFIWPPKILCNTFVVNKISGFSEIIKEK